MQYTAYLLELRCGSRSGGGCTFGRVGWRDDIILMICLRMTYRVQLAMPPQADIRIEAYQIIRSNLLLVLRSGTLIWPNGQCVVEG